MNAASQPFAPAAVPINTECKCCGGTSTLVAVVDAARSGVDARAGRTVEALSVRAVYYHRCSGCGFTFTRAFDHWTAEDFARDIYNADYARHDSRGFGGGLGGLSGQAWRHPGFDALLHAAGSGLRIGKLALHYCVARNGHLSSPPGR